jgi:hypothetical protein
MSTVEQQRDFIMKIDCRFPYHDDVATRELIREGCAIGGAAAFMIAHELACVPYSVEVSTARLEALLAQWLGEFHHPLTSWTAELCRHCFYGFELPKGEVERYAATLKVPAGELHTDGGEYMLLAILTQACLFSDGIDGDALYDEVRSAWK